MYKPNRGIILFISSIILLSTLSFFAVIDNGGTKDTMPLNSPNGSSMMYEGQEYPQSHYYQNLGQITDSSIFYYGMIQGGVIGFGESKIFLWSNENDSDLMLTFVNADPVTPIGQLENKHQTNFFLGDRGTFTGVVSYQEILYKNIWSGIDAVFKMTSEGVKYEFVVAPYANPDDIAILSEGHKEIDIGRLSIVFRMNNVEFIDEGLMAYQDDTSIDVKFIQYDNNVFQFQVGAYDISKSLVIDPLIYSTYLGGSGDEYPEDIVVDSDGNIYITGMTSSANFPTLNPYDNTHGGADDCFFTKYDANGSLVFSTFIGGINDDRGKSIALGPGGDIYITGSTRSSDFPSVNAFNSTYSGDRDVFILRINSDGDTLLYSTYVGGPNDESATVIAVDVQGNMFVAGTAYGPGFPMLNSFDASFNGTWDAFVFKLNADGDELEFSTYIGGSDSEACRSFALDSEGNLVILGQTQSIDFPTFNAYDDTYQGEGTDCFITKLNALGTDLIFSTYIGGSFFDYPIGMDLDSSDNIYVAGQTSSFDFPLVNALQPEHNGHGDCFVFKMNSTGTNLEFSTYVGGWLDDTAFDIAVNESGDIFVGARTRSPDFPIINAFDRTHNGDYDFVLFQLDPTGTNLMYSTFIGGSSYEWVLEMTADNSGNVYIAGSTDSYDFPTINADDSSPNGGGECVVLKIYPSPTDGDANRFSDFLFFTSLSGTPIIVLLLLFVGRHKIRLLLLSRIPTDPSKRARVAGYLFGVLVLFLPYGFSYRPDYLAQLSWTQREFSISLGLFAIKNNVNGLGFEILNSYLGVFLLVFIPLIAYLLRIANKITRRSANFHNVAYALVVFTIVGLVAFFPVLGPEHGTIPIPLHLLFCLPIARWGIPKEPLDPFEGLESKRMKEDAATDQHSEFV